MTNIVHKNPSKLKSFWLADIQFPGFSALKENLSTDILIIGAGITGISTAYCLAKMGKKVTVIDAGEIAGGETGHTAAHLTYAVDYDYSELEKSFGADKARLVLQSHRSAIDFIENTIK